MKPRPLTFIGHTNHQNSQAYHALPPSRGPVLAKAQSKDLIGPTKELKRSIAQDGAWSSYDPRFMQLFCSQFLRPLLRTDYRLKHPVLLTNFNFSVNRDIFTGLGSGGGGGGLGAEPPQFFEWGAGVSVSHKKSYILKNLD